MRRSLPLVCTFAVVLGTINLNAAVIEASALRTDNRAATATALSMTSAEAKGVCDADRQQCEEKPCISYCYRRPCRKVCCGCESPRKLTLQVTDPCCCDCKIKVPVCVPACCEGKPCVTSRCGLFGRGIVTYRWCCGYKLTVTFTRCGDVVVTYFGS